MKKTLLILLIILIPIPFLIFHDKGNEYLKPYLSTYLENKLEQNMSVEVEHLKIDLDYIELDAVLNNLTKVKAKGAVSIFSKALDIEYTLKSNGFKTFDNTIDINGTVIGNFNNLNIKGKGQTLKSHINYALNIKDDVVNHIKVNIDKADIASLLELAAQPAYAKGKVDININIPTLKEMDTKGKAQIILYSTILNEKIFKNEHNIDLPRKTVVTAHINSKVDATKFSFEGHIKSSLASIELSQAIYTLESEELLTNYVLTIPKLTKLNSLIQQKLNGKLKVNGNLQINKNTFNIKGNSKSLAGKIDFNFNGKKLNTKIQNIEIAKLLHLIGEKPYATGKLIADIKLSNLKNLTGTFKVKTSDAKTLSQTLKNELNIDFGKAISFSLNSEGDISSNIVSAQSTINSDIFKYHSSDIKYKLKDSTLSSTYQLDIPKLSKLSALAGKALKGSLAINGEMNYDKSLKITGISKSLGGEIDFNLISQKVDANINNVPVEKLMHVLNFPQVFKALLVGNFQYNLLTKQGTFTSKLNKAQLLSNQLTILIKQIRGLDLTKERYNETEFNAILNKNLMNINFKAKSKKVLLEIPSGRIDKLRNTIDAKYIVNIENKDIGGKIKGNISKPHVSIDSSKFLKDKVLNVIKDNIPKEKLQELGLDKLEPDAIKDTVQNLLGDLFK